MSISALAEDVLKFIDKSSRHDARRYATIFAHEVIELRKMVNKMAAEQRTSAPAAGMEREKLADFLENFTMSWMNSMSELQALKLADALITAQARGEL